MKNLKSKIYLSIAALEFLFCNFKLSAQSVELGLRYMPTFSSFEVYTQDRGRVAGEFTYQNGFGGLLGFNFTDHIGIQGEVIYWDVAQKYRDQNFDRTVELSYLNVPLLLTLNTSRSSAVNLNLVVGPQIGINVGSRMTTTGEDANPPSDAVLAVKKGDLGVAYGAGIDFGLGASKAFRLGLGFRGVYGLIDISDDSNTQVTNSYYVLQRTHVKTYSGYVGLSYLF